MSVLVHLCWCVFFNNNNNEAEWLELLCKMCLVKQFKHLNSPPKELVKWHRESKVSFGSTWISLSHACTMIYVRLILLHMIRIKFTHCGFQYINDHSKSSLPMFHVVQCIESWLIICKCKIQIHSTMDQNSHWWGNEIMVTGVVLWSMIKFELARQVGGLNTTHSLGG